MKTCSKCLDSKEINQFFKDKSKSDGFTSRCKSCIYEKTSLYQKNNSDKRSIWNRNYSLKNKDKIKAYVTKWWQDGGRDVATLYKKNRRKRDNLYRLTMSYRSIINYSFKLKGYKKTSKCANILDCSFEEFKSYLESKFETWMTWDNHGKYNGELNYGWDIDHIIPLSSASSEEDILKLNHYSNLQPLCSYTNRYIKSNK